jgi:catechol 2,3-dioxygenase-like lactoylglutathione lyase family enzyme
MKISEIAFSAYKVTDIERARGFYEGVLGLKNDGVHGGPAGTWIEYPLGPHTLAITDVASPWSPSGDGGMVALEVDNFDAAVAEMRTAGVKFSVEPFASPVCRMAIVTDPDGNTVCIHRRNDPA